MESDFDSVCLDRGEVFRYLGYGHANPDEGTARKVEDSICELLAVWRPRYTAKTSDPILGKKGIQLEDSSILLTGTSIKKHLDGAEKVVTLAATLGIEVERLIRKKQGESIAEGLVVDAVANEAIEKYCNWAQGRIREENTEYFLGSRFSPGYGDLPLNLQKDIIEDLETYKKIGLSCSENCLLIPRKSVTAFIGLFADMPVVMADNCGSCYLAAGCERRKRGLYCGRH